MSPKIDSRSLAAFAAGALLASSAGFLVPSWNAGAWPGDSDTTFVPISPCRLFDTRPASRIGPHSGFGADETKTFAAHGTNGMCSLPADASGLSLNITAAGATENTHLRIWPEGAKPLASSLNPGPGQRPTPNAVVTKLSSSGTFNIYNLKGNVDVLADVNGYYTKSSLQDLDFWTSDLYAAQPFVVTSSSQGPAPAVMSISVDAPHDGQVTVFASVAFASWDPDGGEMAECIITLPARATSEPPQLPGPSDESYQVLVSPSGQPMTGSLLLTRTFPISLNTAAEYVLYCSFYPMTVAGSAVMAADMTAMFTPSY